MSVRGTTTIVVTFLAGGFVAALLMNERAETGQPGVTAAGVGDDRPQDGSVVFQSGKKDCGAASLAMILNRLGRRVTQRELAQRIPMSSNGASLQQLKQAAYEFGLKADGWRLSVDDMTRVRYPAILFLRRGHFVVADSVERSGAVWVRDPASGVARLSREILARSWEGELLLFSHLDSAGTAAKEIARNDRK